MTETRTYPPGVPCWVDTEQPDVAAASEFYAALFGWTFEDAIPPDVPDTYLIASVEAQTAAAIGPSSTSTAAWNMYVAVEDADVGAQTVTSAGGSVLLEPADAGPGGRLVGCADPNGAQFRLWQPRKRSGVQVANVAGSWNFNDLRTADAATAQTFYSTVFGWKFDDLGFSTLIRKPGYGDHLAATIDPGIRERQEAEDGVPPGYVDAVAWLVPAESGQPEHWGTTFAVADRDESAARAQQLGASVLSTGDTPWTKTATIRDPQGAELVLSQYLG